MTIFEPPGALLDTDTDRWITATNSSCVVVLTDTTRMVALSSGRGLGFAVACFDKLTVYYSTNCTLGEYSAFLDGLETDIRLRSPDNVLVAGDFNAKALAWGSSGEDGKGRLLLEFMAGLGLCADNVGSAPTFQGPSFASVIGVTLTRLSRPYRIFNCKTLITCTNSDHNYITFDLADSDRPPQLLHITQVGGR